MKTIPILLSHHSFDITWSFVTKLRLTTYFLQILTSFVASFHMLQDLQWENCSNFLKSNIGWHNLFVHYVYVTSEIHIKLESFIISN
jgi:hypothetical protein